MSSSHFLWDDLHVCATAILSGFDINLPVLSVPYTAVRRDNVLFVSEWYGGWHPKGRYHDYNNVRYTILI